MKFLLFFDTERKSLFIIVGSAGDIGERMMRPLIMCIFLGELLQSADGIPILKKKVKYASSALEN